MTVNWKQLKRENKENSQRMISDIDEYEYNMEMLAIEAQRVSRTARYADVLIEDINIKFEKTTKLHGVDVSFLLLATAMQCIRQYVIGTITQRVDDKTAAKLTKGHSVEHSNRKHRYYNPSLEEIITNPVPFDANIGANGALAGGGKMGHRVTAIGHDPLLGLVFGTANIATSTLTTSQFDSYHITTNESGRDSFKNRASTLLVLEKTCNKLINEGSEGRVKVATSLMKEVIHLRSDIYSTRSLPFPIVSAIDPILASRLADYGLDMGNVVKFGAQAEFAILINTLIGMMHGLFFDESVEYSWDLYSVRTKRIISYSNMIASVSNVIAVAIGSIIGLSTENPEIVKQSLNYLDIGGIMVTIYRVVNDKNFIYEVKKEFLEHEWENIVIG